MKKSLVITILIVVIVAAASFFGGMKYQQNQRANFGRQFATGQGQRPNGNGNRQNFRPVNGEILSADDKSITVKLADGSSKIVLVSDQTSINKAAEAKKEDLKVGEKVAVFGQENSDGSVTAQSIQLNPLMRGQANPN